MTACKTLFALFCTALASSQAFAAPVDDLSNLGPNREWAELFITQEMINRRDTALAAKTQTALDPDVLAAVEGNREWARLFVDRATQGVSQDMINDRDTGR